MNHAGMNSVSPQKGGSKGKAGPIQARTKWQSPGSAQGGLKQIHPGGPRAPGRAGPLTQKAVELALAGSPLALRLCLERLIPPRGTG